MGDYKKPGKHICTSFLNPLPLNGEKMKNRGLLKIIPPILIFILFSTAQVYTQGKGTIKGKIIDAENKQPLVGANILILNTSSGTSTDDNGNFKIENIDAGEYSLRLSYIGYETKVITDIIVKPDRITFVEENLKPSGYELNSVVVTGGYFEGDEIQPISLTSFSSEEIRRAPGAAGDVSRILLSLPGLAKVNDQSNSLIVRGGSPSENAFFINNIEVPNINHFPMQGSTGGPIGMVNVDLVKDINFSAGGFPSIYGDRLSSVVNIDFRDGNKDEFDGQANLDFSGFGGVVEGPLTGKGSYIISVRRSYLDLLIKAIDIGTSIAPRYSDYQWNIVYNLDKNNRLSFIGLEGDDISRSDEKTAQENKMTAYGEQKMNDVTSGINWRYIYGSSGFSNTSVSYTLEAFNENYYDAGVGNILLDNNSYERMIKLRNVNHVSINRNSSIEFGTDAKYIFNNYSNLYGESVDILGNITPEFKMHKNVETYKAAVFLNLKVSPFEKFAVNLGLRSDYFNYNKKLTFDPRISLNYELSERNSLSFSAGIYHQTIPLILLTQNSDNKNLSSLSAVHYILGFDHLITPSTKLSVEIYDKEYSGFPVDPAQPSFFIIDENIYNNSFYSYHQNLINKGRAYSRGIEVLIQKKLAKDIYGLAGASYSKSRYKSLDGKWRDRVYDNRFTFSVEGGYKPNNEWEFSARWILAGGVPYTPFNLSASKAVNAGILDESKVNESRYPPYHCLNVRVDKRFYFDKSDIVVYISIWNAYSRKNVANYYWNSFKNEKGTIYQWPLLPIFGIKYEF